MGADGGRKRRLAVGGMPAWSPSGRELAYVVERRIPARRLITENELRVFRVDEGRSTRLTTPARDSGLIRDPAWSPDSNHLVVRRDDYVGDSGGLVVMNADGSNDRIVAPVEYSEYAGHPAWSPGGETIVFDDSAAIHAVDSSGANRRVLRIGDRDSDPTWSPDRRSIAFHRTPGYSSLAGGYVAKERGLHVVSSNGRNLRSIRGFGFGDSDGYGEMPAWSPSGRWIAYMYGNLGIALHDLKKGRGRVLVCERAPGADCDGRGVYAPSWTSDSSEVLYWSNLDSSFGSLSSRKVTGRPGRFLRNGPCIGEHSSSDDSADASPGGRWLLITSRGEIWKVPVSGCRGGPFAGNPRGRGAERLAEGHAAVWSPDGKRIAFVSDRDGDDELYVVRSNGSGLRRLTRNVWDDVQPDW